MSESLRELLSKLQAIDDDLAPEDFNPMEIVGDVKSKVDACKWRIDTWRAQATMVQEKYINEFTRKKKSLEGKADALEDYLKSQMQLNGYDKLPGEMFRVQLQNTSPSVQISLEPTPEMFIKHGDVMTQKISYSWNLKAIREILENGEPFENASLKQNKCIRFYPQAGDGK